MIGGKRDGRIELHRDQYFFSGHGAFAVGCFVGSLLIPFTTEFNAVKLGFTSVAEKVRLPSALSRVAESISTSAGELVRVRTFPEGGFDRVTGENVIDLNFNVTDAGEGCSQWQQASECRLTDDGGPA